MAVRSSAVSLPHFALTLPSSCFQRSLNAVPVHGSLHHKLRGIRSLTSRLAQILTLVPSENLIRWIRSRKENRIMIETDGDLLQTSARIYVGLLSFA